MKSILGIFSGSALLLTALGAGAQDSDLTTDKNKYSYTAGYQIGSQMQQRFSQEGMGVDTDAFADGIVDALNGAEAKLSDDEMQAVVEKYRQAQVDEQAGVASGNQAAGEAFMAENKTKEGVFITDSGLQYKVLTEGSGKNPGATDTVVVHYRGALIDGTEFDSSYSRGNPATFSLDGIIPGWQEALQLMRPGAKWQVFIPAELGYGERGAGGSIGPNQALVFDIELIEIK